MFKVYQKYIIKKFLINFSKVSMVFLSLTCILGIIEEVNFFKDLDVNFFLPFFITLLNVPITLFEIFPFIIFIATLLFSFDFLKNDELDLLKKNGIKNINILKTIFFTSIFIGIINITIYYNIAANLKFYYSDIKNSFSKDNKYLAMVTDSGLWIKDEINEKKYIIKSRYIKENFLHENIINEFNSEFKLNRIIQSQTIDITDNNWIIYDPIITKDNITNNLQRKILLLSNFNYQKINSIFSNITSLDLLKLYEFRSDYKNLGYSVVEIDILLLRLYTTPLFYGIMSVFAIIVIFNSTKKKPLLFHLIFGITISVIIYYINFIFNSLGINGKIPLNLSVLFPFYIILVISIIGLIKINEK